MEPGIGDDDDDDEMIIIIDELKQLVKLLLYCNDESGSVITVARNISSCHCYYGIMATTMSKK